ncbi:MAG: GMC family oxidoreductase, partial [Gammaproteobacteria bacterium]|nr:GMC family oxidoreductase [Gammaproteobacteria bacterium]
DLCVIGAGAAGITIARELAGTPIRVCLLESGGVQPDPQTQALYEGENVGLPYYDLTELRLRFLGGTTNHWSGVCGPLDPIDFQRRSWVPLSGWPLERPDLDPYYERAHVVCELGPYEYRPQAWEGPSRRQLPLDPDRIRSAMYQASPPTRFGSVYRDMLESAANIDTYLHANAVDLVAVGSGRGLSHVRGATLAGNGFVVRAKEYVLATGAIENARLLLASDGVHRGGLGNGNGLVGRHFMEHLAVPSGLLVPADEGRLRLYTEEHRLGGSGVRGKAFLALSRRVQEREELLNARAYIDPADDVEALRGTSPGVESVYGLMQSLRDGGDAAAYAANVAQDLDGIVRYSYRRLFRPPKLKAYWLYMHMENAPHADSRVTLSDERDALGMRRVQLDWRLGDLERRTFERCARIMAEELGRAGVGRVRLLAPDVATGWPTVYRGLRGAWHQMGTTRMDRDPRRGVVDEQCRVHGVANLSIAGSSVFPTSGYTNPTLTLVALSIRLADRLKGELA